MTSTWPFWAFASAVFAALTAIFGKIGVEGVGSAFATLIRTCVILLVAAAMVAGTKSYQSLASIGAKTYLFLVLSGVATGLSWLCYYQALKTGPAAGVVSIDKLSVVIVAVVGVCVLGERLSAMGWLGVAMIAGGAILVGLQA
ncbi:MAG: EamA family transporter [Rhodospirillaceae bacterium]|nr:EamA family transporter [Rhodospirillaceae bacterium]